MSGENCHPLHFDNRGAVGDRLYAVKSEERKFGSGKTTRRLVKIDGLFSFSSVYDGEIPVISFPNGKVVRGNDVGIDSELSKSLNQTVTLSKEQTILHFDDSPVHIVTTDLLDRLKSVLSESIIDERRFHSNIVIETKGGELLVQNRIGKTLKFGEVGLEITHPTELFVMVYFPQSNIPEDKRIFTRIGRKAGLNFGIYAKVLVGGNIKYEKRIKII
jgi:uncharacterized protein